MYHIIYIHPKQHDIYTRYKIKFCWLRLNIIPFDSLLSQTEVKQIPCKRINSNLKSSLWHAFYILAAQPLLIQLVFIDPPAFRPTFRLLEGGGTLGVAVLKGPNIFIANPASTRLAFIEYES
ncbi:hypothetical protein AMTRI_Chr09g37710 [Amborella trichopoda]